MSKSLRAQTSAKKVFNQRDELTVSVIIPTYNSPWLDQTLAGMRAQTYNPSLFEVLVVGQDTYNQVQEDVRVRLFSTEKPQPPAVARNWGLSRAQGDVVCFIDSDCVPQPNWLEILMARFADPAVSVVGGGIDFPQKGYWSRCDALASAYEQLSFQPAGTRRQLPSMNFSARRAVLLDFGGFDKSYPYPSGEDADLCMRLRQQDYTLHFEPQARISHLGWRRTLPAVLGHIQRYGEFSPWINPELEDVVKPPFFFKHWFSMACVAPFLAGWISLRMYLRQPQLLKLWHLLPGLYLVQLAWCRGIVQALYQRQRKQIQQ